MELALFLLKGILIGLLFGVPVGAVGTMTIQRSLEHGGESGAYNRAWFFRCDCSEWSAACPWSAGGNLYMVAVTVVCGRLL